MATNANGRYIKKRLSLCHRPSLSIGPFLKSCLSDITKRVKNAIDKINEIMLTIPIVLSELLKDRIAIRSGTKRKSMNPITEPAPWIFDAAVTSSLDSLTLKKQVRIQAPTAKKEMKIIKRTVTTPDSG